MRIQPGQLGQQHAQPLRFLGNLQRQQPLHGQAIAEVVGHRAEVVDPVGQRNNLLIKLGLAGLLDAGMQVADLRVEPDHDLAVDLHHQAQNSVHRRVLRAHIQHHVLIVRAFGHGASRMGMPIVSAHLAIPLHRIVLAQRMPLPVVRHHDAAQVGMPLEAYAEEVEDLALIKIG